MDQNAIDQRFQGQVREEFQILNSVLDGLLTGPGGAKCLSRGRVTFLPLWNPSGMRSPQVCGQTVVEHWNGSRWTRLTTPNPGVADYLTGIAATSANDVWAVGYEWISNFVELPLLLHYNGTTWKQFNTSQFQFGQVSSVFARATNDVWAVGWTGQGPNVKALALHWNGTAWKRVAFPTEAGGWIVLKSVSGVAGNDVWAVGSYQFSDINGLSLRARSYHWNGSRWAPVIHREPIRFTLLRPSTM
jgi:hypothetical protein